eukprot:CAMPEP_0175079618 /NCGR_PEP_ID=MMETSP0052_2-20121109/24930_1 /TAXON_ID=51329 ORGANISM="Polytomella parva, Strain SAG 63-3" /NCGR_SAMPLE_ID=MMETSP0052_2 /ASSEMBLY_ACC=CAM_ASM_000194 /LENGTH=688 /DNA_ID=CAMNT_0016349983 /DNA_START=1100 /DNA_END=3163 /DNA_ORIENTATION=+
MTVSQFGSVANFPFSGADVDPSTIVCAFPDNRTRSTDGLLHDSVSYGTNFSCTATVLSNSLRGLQYTYVNTAVKLSIDCQMINNTGITIDAAKIKNCVNYDILGARDAEGAVNFSCTADTTPSPTLVPVVPSDINLHVNCSADAIARPDSIAVSFRTLLGSVDAATTMAALLCPSTSSSSASSSTSSSSATTSKGLCSRPAATFMQVLGNWSRQSHLDVFEYLNRPPPPQPPDRRQSPPPPPPPNPLAQYWRIEYDTADAYCLNMSLVPRDSRTYLDEPYNTSTQVYYSFDSLSSLYNASFAGGFQNLTAMAATTCAYYGYTPYRIPSLRMSGAGLVGDLGSTILKSPYLTDEIPVSNLIELDLSNNSISGVLPSNTSYFPGFLYPSLIWNLSRNAISGSIANETFFHSALALDLSYNRLSGILPANWTVLETATYIDLSYNNLSGTLPALWALDDQLYTNAATAVINTRRRSNRRSSRSARHLQQSSQKWYAPPVLVRVRGFTHVKLSNNRLSGSLPASWVTLANTVLDLSDNALVGTVPSSTWVNVQGMERFDISGNLGLSGVVTGVGWDTLLNVLRVRGTSIRLDLNSLASYNSTSNNSSSTSNSSSTNNQSNSTTIPTTQSLTEIGSLWATVVRAVQSKSVGFENLLTPKLKLDDLHFFCDLFHAYHDYRQFFVDYGYIIVATN